MDRNVVLNCRKAKPMSQDLTSPVDVAIVPRAHDVGGFEVHRGRRLRKKSKMVGPFIFFDQMGPWEFLAGQWALTSGRIPRSGSGHRHLPVRRASILHRDSLGTQLPIVPGDVNWMTAGRGIAHSERTDANLRTHSNPLFGIQSWAALPKAMEEKRLPPSPITQRRIWPLLQDNGRPIASDRR